MQSLDPAKFDRQQLVLLVPATNHSNIFIIATRHTIDINSLISIKIMLLFLISFIIDTDTLSCHYKPNKINQNCNSKNCIIKIVNLEWNLILTFINWLIIFTNSAFVPYTVFNQKQSAQINDFCLWKFIFHWPNTTFAIGNSLPFGLLFFCVCFLFFLYFFYQQSCCKMTGGKPCDADTITKEPSRRLSCLMPSLECGCNKPYAVMSYRLTSPVRGCNKSHYAVMRYKMTSPCGCKNTQFYYYFSRSTFCSVTHLSLSHSDTAKSQPETYYLHFVLLSILHINCIHNISNLNSTIPFYTSAYSVHNNYIKKHFNTLFAKPKFNFFNFHDFDSTVLACKHTIGKHRPMNSSSTNPKSKILGRRSFL